MEKGERINQKQFFGIITNKELSWQSLIYELIKTEQLDPWDIDLGLLAEKYVEKISLLEEADFFISSKVLLACSLLLRLKSDILATSYIQELDDELYGKKEVQSYLDLENFEIDEDELPILIPKTPLARSKKVTLEELMKALNHAMNTENRRIKRHIKTKQAERSLLVVLPNKFIPLKIRVKKFHDIISNRLILEKNKSLSFRSLAEGKEEKLSAFLPILHLANEEKIHLWQPIHFRDIHITKEMHPEDKDLLSKELIVEEIIG